MNRIVHKTAVFSFFLALCGGLVLSCASTNKTVQDEDSAVAVYEKPEAPVEQPKTTPAEAESIKLPSARPKSYFAKIDEDIVKKVEYGSAQSISQAMSLIYRSDADYTANEKVLIYIAAEMTKTLWPSQKITWAVYDVSDETPYIGALNSVKKESMIQVQAIQIF